MARHHDREYFYKYMSVNTIKAVLTNLTIRWSSPLLFNDPFDHQILFDFNFTDEEFVKGYLDAYEQAIFGDENVEFDTSTREGAIFKLMRDGRSRLDKTEVLAEIKESVMEVSRGLGEFKDKINAELQRELNILRVLCITEDNDNIVMWSHYADNHRGVAIKLRCIDKLDNMILASRRVEYQDDYPLIASLEDIIHSFLGIKKYPYERLFDHLPYIKHTGWSYEKEWRASFPEDMVTEEMYTDYKLNPLEIESIYYGCEMDPGHAEEITSLLEGPLSHVEIYRAEKGKDKFGLQFNRIR